MLAAVAIVAVAVTATVLGTRPRPELVFTARADGAGVTSTHAVVPARIAWSTAQAGSSDPVATSAQPVAVTDRVLVVGTRAGLRGVDLATGATRYELDGACCAVPGGDGLVIRSEGFHLAVYDAETGDRRQRIRLPDPPLHVAVVHDGVAVYYRADLSLVGVDLATGSQLWERATAALHRVTADRLLVLEDGEYTFLDVRTGVATPTGVTHHDAEHLQHASPEVLLLVRHDGQEPRAHLVDLATGRRVDLPHQASNELAAVGVTADEIVLHLHGARGRRLVVSRDSGEVRTGEVDREELEVLEVLPVQGRSGTVGVLWRTTTGLVWVHPATLERHDLGDVDGWSGLVVDGYLVLEQGGPPGSDPEGVFHVFDERGRSLGAVRLTDLPPPPAGWLGTTLPVLLRDDGAILDLEEDATIVRRAVDGEQIGRLPQRVVATTAAGDVTTRAGHVSLRDRDGQALWSRELPASDEQASVTVLGEHVVVLQPPDVGPWTGGTRPTVRSPAMLATYLLRDGSPLDSLALPDDLRVHAVAVRAGSLWLLGEGLARVDVDASGEAALAWHLATVPFGTIGEIDVQGDEVVSYGPWAVVRWAADTGGARPPTDLAVPVRGQGAVHAGRLLSTSGRTLVAMDLASGEVVWDVDLPGHPSSGVSVAGDRAYVGLADGTLVTVLLADGGGRHDVSTGELPIVRRPVIARGKIVVEVGEAAAAPHEAGTHLVTVVAERR